MSKIGFSEYRLGQLNIAVVLVLTTLISVGGCSDNVSQKSGGQVLVDGKPVTTGTIKFYPIEGGRMATSAIAKDGTFVLSYRGQGDGLPAGEYKVAIISDVFEPSGPAEPSPAQDDPSLLTETGDLVSVGAGKLIHVVPTRYNDINTTTLTQKVEISNEPQKFIFDIPSK